jgi:hypothetical protein
MIVPAETADDQAVACVLIPAYDDWSALARLVPALDLALAAAEREAELLVVDDGSPGGADVLEAALAADPPHALRRVSVLRLVRNLGHQRAIAVGLSARAAAGAAGPTVVMDGDGEDRPADVPLLLRTLEANDGRVVFAQRKKRSEGLGFRMLYRAYRFVQRALTGATLDVGNFSAVPASLLPGLTATADIWNHYPAAVLNARVPVHRLPLDRGERLEGRSRLGLPGLVLHGLGAMSVFSERMGMRLLAAAGLLALGVVAMITGVVAIRFGTDLAIPGWATYTVGLLLVMLIQTLGLGALFTFSILNGRNASRFIPRRDHVHFVDTVRTLYERPAGWGNDTAGSRRAATAG